MPICCGTMREEITITFPHGMREVMGISSRMVSQQIGNGNYLPRDVVVNLRFPSSNGLDLQINPPDCKSTKFVDLNST